MPASNDPHFASTHPKHIIEIQRNHRSTARRRQTHDLGAIFTPGEMLIPALTAGMKQQHLLTSPGIGGYRAGAFAAVARRAGQTEILQASLTAGRERDDVVHFQGDTGHAGLGATVFTLFPGSFRYLAA